MGLTRKTVVWVAREATVGTDPAMTSSNALLAFDLDLTVEGEKLDRPVLRDSLSPLAHVNGIKETVLTFKTEIKGNGLTGTQPNIPEIGVPLSGCGFDTGVYSGTSLKYSLISEEANMSTLAFRAFFDSGVLNKALGMRGTVKFNMEAGKYGIAEWEFRGVYVAASAATVPTLAGLGTEQPPTVINSSFQIAGFTPVCSTAEIDLQNEITRRDDLNAVTGVHSYRLTGRTPVLNFNADAVAESSNPFHADYEGEVIDTFGINVGTNAGNRLLMSGHFIYEKDPKNSDTDGVRTYDCVASLVSSTPNDSNDELVLNFL